MAKGINHINNNPATRFVPDMDKLGVPTNGTAGLPAAVFSANGASIDTRSLNYETSDLNEITRRQLTADISAYRYDLDFCLSQVATADLTPQETRTFQLRILDLGHQIRHCQHRIEQIQAQARLSAAASPSSYGYQQHRQPQHQQPQRGSSASSHQPRQPRPSSTPSGAASAGVKRRKTADSEEALDDDDAAEIDSVDDGYMPVGPTTSIQRLGYWKCHLCKSHKYLEAGPQRVPSAPCKWPLKDISKMMNHFLDLHTEHSPRERCAELGDALAQNRGPFEYWLTRTKTQSLGDGSIIDDCIEALQTGHLPETLRSLSKAAAAFPN